MWRMAHALAGKNYKIPGTSNLQCYLLTRLLVEKSIDALAPSLEFINDLEEICSSIPQEHGGIEGKVRVQTDVHRSTKEETGAPERGS